MNHPKKNEIPTLVVFSNISQEHYTSFASKLAVTIVSKSSKPVLRRLILTYSQKRRCVQDIVCSKLFQIIYSSVTNTKKPGDCLEMILRPLFQTYFPHKHHQK